MRSDVEELLSGFENRMRFISIVKAILNNDNVVRNQEIREILPDKDMMDNLVVMVLLFIKERTLYDDKICTLRDIAGFIDDGYGSTVVVPEDWVRQTGSDMDFDSIYSMVWETSIDKDGHYDWRGNKCYKAALTNYLLRK